MISVIIPVYKAELAIARCIESVVAQEYKDWELILVDDGSPDKSGEICDDFATMDERIHVVHQENAGASAARNHGIDIARGDYVCFIDADDYVSPKYLVDFIPDVSKGFAIQGMTSIYPIRKVQYDRIPSVSLQTDICGLLKEPSVWELLSGPCCKLFRTDVIEKNQIRFPNAISYGEDEIFVKQYLCFSPDNVYIVGKSNYFYFKEDTSSLSGKKRDGQVVYNSVVLDYQFFLILKDRYSTIPDDYCQFYRKHKANDFYSSLYLLAKGKTMSLWKMWRFLCNIDPDMICFFIEEKELPKTYRILRFFLNIYHHSLSFSNS